MNGDCDNDFVQHEKRDSNFEPHDWCNEEVWAKEFIGMFEAKLIHLSLS